MTDDSNSGTAQAGRFDVLFVCTANLCRSPMAENMFRASLRRLGLDWSVASAGVRAQDGSPMHPHSATVLEELGIEHDGWVSRRLTAEAVRDADLVLTAEKGHRQAVVALQPGAVRYTFTLLQFAGLLGLVPPPADAAGTSLDEAELGDVDDLIRAAELARSRPQARQTQSVDLADPMGRSVGGFRQTAQRIDEALTVILNGLRVGAADSPALDPGH